MICIPQKYIFARSWLILLSLSLFQFYLSLRYPAWTTTTTIIAGGAATTSNNAFPNHQLHEQQQHLRNDHHLAAKIPNSITFTHFINLRNDTEVDEALSWLSSSLQHLSLSRNRSTTGSDYSNSNNEKVREKEVNDKRKKIKEVKALIKEIKALRDNVRRIVDLHPGATVRFLTDEDCAASVRRVYAGRNRAEEGEELARFFSAEKKGMYKADVCRGAALYETGGLYFDVDLGVRMSTWDFLKNSSATTFATIKSLHWSPRLPPGFFQAFIAVTPRSQIMTRYLDLFLDLYRGNLDPKYREFKNYGTYLLRRAYDDVVATDVDPPIAETSELFEELEYPSDTQLDDVWGWNSTRFKAEIIPPPTWHGKNCDAIVIRSREDWPDIVAPFYSRIANSRMCSDDVAKLKKNNNNNNKNIGGLSSKQ